MPLRIFQRTCLRSNYALRRQLVVSYGVTAFVTIFLVVIAATIAALRAGDTARDEARNLLSDQYIESLRESGRLTAQIFSKKWTNVESSVSLLAEVVRDRIVGYPNEFADDRHVPFVDRETGERKYPLNIDLLPRDWQVQSNWNESNLEEHTQERAELSKDLIGIMSTESSFFSFQGNCNPEHTLGMAGYYQGCTDDNNNATIGGVIHPTDTLEPLEQKAADISVFMKPIWEAEPGAMAISVYFFNSGAGAALQFPSFTVHSEASYVSAGCDWMKEINQITGEPFGTTEEMANCNKAGTAVPIRLYNPMEREFCADQALHPGETRISGPYLDAVWGTWRLTVGQAVFDRLTGSFIACTAVDVSLELATGILESITHYDNRTELAVARVDGTVVAGAGTSSEDTDTVHIGDTEFMNQETYSQLTRDLYFWEQEYDSESSYVEAFKSNIERSGDKLYSVYTSPRPPSKYDPNFVPDFLIFTLVEVEDVFAVVIDIEEQISSDVSRLIVTTIILGFVGFLALLGFVFAVAQLLTRPLLWMENIAWQIVNHSDKRVGDNLEVAQNFAMDPLMKCIPKTEASELVDEFESMITGFSGEGASKAASFIESELRNAVTWKNEFVELYNVDPSEESKLRKQMNRMSKSVSRRMSRSRASPARLDTASVEEASAEFRSAEMGSMKIDEDVEFQSPAFAMMAKNSVQSTGEPSLEIRSSTIFSRKSVSRVPFADSEAVDPALRMNPGSHLHNSEDDVLRPGDEAVRVIKSSLFWWILVWIAFPILLSIIAISVIVALRLDDTFPQWISSAKISSFGIEIDRLAASAHLRAKFAEQVIPGPIRDLHVLTRISGWLLFGAIGRSDSFTEVEMEFVDECKIYDVNEVCPYEADEFRTPCDCDWNDPWDRECREPPIDSRLLQRMFYMSQNRDSDPETGNRNESVSFPSLDYSAETTSWWRNPQDMPGASKASNAAGHETAYDRLRVISAAAAVTFPLYNYVNNLNKPESHTAMSAYVAFEADGAFFGYAGCNYDFSRYASFESTENNEAYLIHGDLCPKGKFGYDPRCRSWYNSAKLEAVDNGDGVFVSAPYKYATVNSVGNTAVSPLVDPDSGEFVGSSLIDFATTEMFQILDRSDAGVFAVVIANGPDESSLVSSSLDQDMTAESIGDVVLPYDSKISTHAIKLDAVLDRMKAGDRVVSSLERTDADGIMETIHYSHSPILLRELKAIAPDDFSRGIEASEAVLYSLIIAEPEEKLLSRFAAIDDGIQQDLRKTNAIFLIVTSFITLVCILVTARISKIVTKPVILLLHVVKRVNEGRIGEDMPPLKGGSREVHQVYTSFAKLYKIMQISNSSFFSGDLDWALHIASDALQLFRKIGDEKAIAIASNNMGNALFALTVARRTHETCLCLEDSECCVKSALACYDETVDLGTKEFKSVDSDAEKCVYAQQLADRHFNRAMCLLHTADDPCAPEQAKEQAFADLHLSKQYDQGVKEYMLASRTLFKNSDIMFERSLRRLYGLAQLTKIDPDVWQVWDIYDLVDHSDLMVQAAWNQTNAPLFKSVSRVGRLQQLEGAVASVEFSSGNFKDAALLSTRMLVEDEYTIESAFVEAADCLLKYIRETNQASKWSNTSLSVLKQELRQMRKSTKKATLDIGRSYVVCFDLSGNWNGTDALQDIKFECLTFYEENCLPTDSFGVVAFDPQEGELRILKPQVRMGNEAAQRDAIVAATTGVASSKFTPSLADAVNLVMKAASRTASDVYLVYITDGRSWTPETFEPLQEKIRKASGHRSASIDILVVGLDVENPKFVESCKGLCLATRSRNSKYFAAEVNALDQAFENVETLVNSGTSFDGNRLLHGLTMEKF